MKYRIGWAMTTYYEAIVEADSVDDAKYQFDNTYMDDYAITGDAGDAEISYIEKV